MEKEELVQIRDAFRDVLNDLMSAKNILDSSPEVKTSRRLQGAIAKCSLTCNRIEEKIRGDHDSVVQKNNSETTEPASINE